MGIGLGYWNNAKLRVAPIRLVHIANKYPNLKETALSLNDKNKLAALTAVFNLRSL